MASAVMRMVVLCLIATVPRLAVRVRVRGLARAPRRVAAYYAMCHRRDLDAVLPVPALIRQLGLRAALGGLRFAQRSDSFEPGFVGRQVYAVRWAAWLLHTFSVGAVVRLLGIFPLTDIRRRPAASWLRAWLATEGDATAEKALAFEFRTQVAASGGEPVARLSARPVRQLLRWRYHEALDQLAGPEIFAGDGRHRAQAQAVMTAHAELAAVSTWLRSGGSLYTSPEGRLSPDGRICRVTAQIHRVLSDSPSVTPVVPIMLTYDFMRPGRMRAYVRVALPIANAPMLASAKLDALLRARWIAEATFTCTQIASAWLIARGPEPFTTGELAAAIYADARHLQSTGHHVTVELLRPAGALHAARGYLGWSARHRVVGRVGRNRWRALPQPAMRVPNGDVGYRRWPLAYANNEYREWREGAADTGA